MIAVLEFIGSLRPLLAKIERRDRDLGRQLRRASSKVALNLAVGMYSQGAIRAGVRAVCGATLAVAERRGSPPL